MTCVDSRRLVGMTEGAKKRKAQQEERVFNLLMETPDPLRARTKANFRRKYRIGERLRPCLGCAQCNAVIRDAIYGQRSEYDAPIVEDGPCGGSFVVDKKIAGPASAVHRERRFS